MDGPGVGEGFKMVTLAVLGVTMSAARMAAVSRVAFTKVVVREAPFHWTVEPFTKLLPLTFRLKPAPPAVAELGTRLVSVTAGTRALIIAAPLNDPHPVALS